MFVEKKEIEVDVQRDTEIVQIYFKNKEINSVWILKLEEYLKNSGLIEKEIYRHIVSWNISSCYFDFFSY
jgi:hypothetical protein